MERGEGGAGGEGWGRAGERDVEGKKDVSH